MNTIQNSTGSVRINSTLGNHPFPDTRLLEQQRAGGGIVTSKEVSDVATLRQHMFQHSRAVQKAAET